MKILFSIIILTLLGCSGSNSEQKIDSKQDSTIQSKISSDKAQIIEPIVDDEIKTYTKNGVSLVEIKAEDYSKTSLKLSTNQFKEGINALSFLVEGISK